jgi:hypothetical protein
MLWVIGFAIVFVALMIPILAIVLDSPALKHLFESRRASAPGEVNELARKVSLLEDQVDDLTRSLEGLKEEQQFLHQLLENPERGRPSKRLPPP